MPVAMEPALKRMISPALVMMAPMLAAQETVTLAGVEGVRLLDAGIFDVSGGPTTARTEIFEFLRRSDGGVTLLSATTMADGSVRVQARYDYDARWNAVSGIGQGLYGDEPVRVEMRAKPGAVEIRVRGERTSVDATIDCPDGCFMDMAPSGSPMFVMTRHYDHKRGGMQSFQWAAQDLPRPFTSPNDQRAALNLRRELPVARRHGGTLRIREYEMVERIPTPNGGIFVMEFDLWTDEAERPLGYRINMIDGKPPAVPIVGFRRGYEDVRVRVAGSGSRALRN